LNRGESIEDELAGSSILDTIAFDIVGDIFDKISKESDLLDLIKTNKLLTCKSIVCDPHWGAAIRRAPVCLNLNGGELVRWVTNVGEPIGQRKG
jgi:hypothetical protein